MNAQHSDDDPRVALGRALAAAGLGTGPRLVALALWTYADFTTGAGARPSTATLATVVGRAARDVRRFLRELEQAGIIDARPVPGKTTSYRFLIHTPGYRDPGLQGPGVTGTRGHRDPGTPGPPDPPPRGTGTRQTPELHEQNSSAREPRSPNAADLARTILLLLDAKLPRHQHLDPAEVERQAARLDALGWTAPALAVELDRIDLTTARKPSGLAVTVLRGLGAPPLAPVPPIPTPASRCDVHGRPYGRDGTATCGVCPDRTLPALAAVAS